MLKTIEIKNVKANPFNARRDYAEEPINELAKEIQKVGFWAATLRGRETKDGKIELCFGHRRLAALKKIGWKEVKIDVVDLDDEEMATQGLVENLQRQGLNDMEKAEGIKQLAQRLAMKTGESKEKINTKIATMLGIGEGWLEKIISITQYSEPIKKLIADKKIAARTAIEAHHFGKDEMVKTAAREHIPLHTITKFSKALEDIPEEIVRKKIKDKIVRGEITDPKEIGKKAEPMLRAKAEKGKPPPDLIVVIAEWTSSIKGWRKALRAVIPYRDYLDTSPTIAKEFRDEVQGLIAELEKLL